MASQLSDKRILAGLIGQQIQASGSPRIHQDEAAAHGLNLTYRLADLNHPKRDDSFIEPLLQAMQTFGFAGTNVTHPYKEVAFKLVDSLSKEAEQIGSINTIVFRDGKRHGDNTDWIGFTENLKASIPNLVVDRVALIGTGGAGLAVAYGMLRLGTKSLRLYDARKEKAEQLAEKLRKGFPDREVIVAEDAASALRDAHGLIQATPVGMLEHPGLPLDVKLLRPELWVADLIYFPLETELVKAAKALGCRAIGGGGMAVRQAAASFRQFFDVEPDIPRMLSKFEKAQK